MSTLTYMAIATASAAVTIAAQLPTREIARQPSITETPSLFILVRGEERVVVTKGAMARIMKGYGIQDADVSAAVAHCAGPLATLVFATLDLKNYGKPAVRVRVPYVTSTGEIR